MCQHSHGSLLASAAMSRLVQMKAIPPVLLLAPLHQTSALVQPPSQTRRRGLKLGPGRVEHSHWSRSFEILRSHWLLLRQISDAIKTQLKLKLNRHPQLPTRGLVSLWHKRAGVATYCEPQTSSRTLNGPSGLQRVLSCLMFSLSSFILQSDPTTHFHTFYIFASHVTGSSFLVIFPYSIIF